jgi:hypothetical protein
MFIYLSVYVPRCASSIIYGARFSFLSTFSLEDDDEFLSPSFFLSLFLCGVVDSPLFTSSSANSIKKALLFPYYRAAGTLFASTHTHTHTHRERERESFDDASTKQKEEESASFCRRFCRGGEEKEEDKE